MKRQKSLKELQTIMEGFNSEFPVGSKVILRKDSGEIETSVRAPAEVLSGHSAVGWFAGVSGCYSIEGRVRHRVPLSTDPVSVEATTDS